MSPDKQRRFRALIGLALLTTVAPPCLAVTLVEKGRARAVIIVADTAESDAIRQADAASARILQEHLKQISGADLPVRRESEVTAAAGKDEAWILVGQGRLAKEMGFA